MNYHHPRRKCGRCGESISSRQMANHAGSARCRRTAEANGHVPTKHARRIFNVVTVCGAPADPGSFVDCYDIAKPERPAALRQVSCVRCLQLITETAAAAVEHKKAVHRRYLERLQELTGEGAST